MNFKLFLAGLLLLATLVFAVQNAAVVEVKFAVWQFSISLALVVFASFVSGLLGGWITISVSRLKRKADPPRST